MTKQNKYSKKSWLKPNKGRKERRMAKHPMGKLELPWHYQQMIETFDTNMAVYHQSKIEQRQEQEEGVSYKIV
jgi:hypothetical protein